VTDARAMGYGKLVDLSYSKLTLRPSDIKTMAAKVNRYARSGDEVLGAVAIVADAEISSAIAELFASRTAEAGRPLRLVASVGEGLEWLESLRPQRFPKGDATSCFGK